MDIHHLFADYASWKRNAPQPFILTTLCHANENAHTRILKALLQHTDSEGRHTILESFLREIVGADVQGGLTNVCIADQQASVGQKDGSNGFIDLLITYQRGDEEYTIIIENKIHDAADSQDQLNRYVYDHVDHLGLGLDEWKSCGEFSNNFIYVMYLSSDGSKHPDASSLSDPVRNSLGDHFVERSYADDMLPWLYNVLSQLPYGSDGMMIAGVRQYIAGLEELLGMNSHEWKSYDELRKAFSDLSDAELWQFLEGAAVSADSDELADEFNARMKDFRRSIFAADAPEGWTLHVTPSFTSLYPCSWREYEDRKHTIPSVFYIASTSKLMAGKGSDIKWKLQLTHLPKDLLTSQSLPARLLRGLKNPAAWAQGAVPAIQQGLNHGRDAVIGEELSVARDFDINDAASRASYYKDLTETLNPYTETVSRLLR